MSRLSIGEAIQQVVGVLSEVSDTSEVLRAIAVTARQMMLADEAYLLLREGGQLVLRAADGLPQELLGRRLAHGGEGIEGWVAEHGEPVAVSDASRERRFRDLFSRGIRVRALAVVPMRLHDDVVGVLATAGMDPFPPTGSRLTGLEILAGIGAVAIENDRLLRQERSRTHQAEVLLDLASIREELELRPLLEEVVKAISQALGVDDAELVLLDEKGQEVLCAGRGGGPDCTESGYPSSLNSGWAAQVIATGQPLLFDDVARDPRLGIEFHDSGTRSLMAAAIPVRGERRGALRVSTTRTASFRSEDLAFITLIASQVGLLVERTELASRQLEVSREEARQQARQEFFGLVSHELKTPVAVLKAYTELLMRKAEIDPQRDTDRDVLGRMLEQTDRMLAMIQQLLDLQKLETGGFALEMSRFDLAELARKEAENLQLTAGSRRIVVQAAGRPMVMADRRRIEEVLFNLLENAIKYSPPDSFITVTVGSREKAESDSPAALVSVADQGIGIPAQDLTRIFERFFQRQGRFLRGHVGLGLGLYIAREIVERHGGKIWAESSEGAGSTFHFTLPLASTGEEE